MTFADATLAELPIIVDIYNSTVASRLVTADTSPVAVADKLNWFHAHNSATRPLWIIREEDTVIGWVSYNDFYGRPAYKGTAELSIYLQPDWRKKGYGKKILRHCMDEAPRLGLHTILGFIFSHNAPSIELFLQAGFSEWGNLKDVAIMDGNPYSLIIFGKKI